MEMISNEEKITQAVLVSVDTGDYDAEASLAELKELVKSAGAEPVFTVTQNLKRPETGTYVGTGKLQEIADICKQQVFDCELSPTQIRNIEAETDTRTIDRTMLILDIFALRARSKEGKLQVELAQLKYLMPRLTGKGVAMSRLGGGIGTRGPGETKLEPHTHQQKNGNFEIRTCRSGAAPLNVEKTQRKRRSNHLCNCRLHKRRKIHPYELSY